MFDVALLDQVLDRAGDVFDWYYRIDAVLIKQISRVDSEALEGRLSDCLVDRAPLQEVVWPDHCAPHVRDR